MVWYYEGTDDVGDANRMLRASGGDGKFRFWPQERSRG